MVVERPQMDPAGRTNLLRVIVARHSIVPRLISPMPISTPTESHAASYARAAGVTPGPADTTGSISGKLIYPSDFLPPQAVYAITTDGGTYYRVDTVSGQQTYTMVGVATGDYFVFSTTRRAVYAGADPGTSNTRFGAAYTKSVLCGLDASCTDHSVLTVHVSVGTTVSNVDATDWYAGPDVYPVIPGGAGLVYAVPAPPANFASSQDAAIYQAQTMGARYVATAATCGVNEACVWLTSNHAGQNAAYYIGSAGSNRDLQNCAFYVAGNQATWRPLGTNCANSGAPFPAVGATGRVRLMMGEQGCVNVHDAPGVGAKVVACLNDGTQVQVDDGPVYLGPVTAASPNERPSWLDYWWHVAGRGWMVHQYIR
jgi:hypothetical protein